MILDIAKSFVELIATIFLWKTLFQEQAAIDSYTWDDMIIYTMIAFFMKASMSWGTESKISSSVLDGSIIMELVKPISYQVRCFFETMGSCIIEGSVAFVAAVVSMVCLCDICAYLIPERCLLLIISLILAFLIRFCITYLVGLTTFYTTNGVGIMYLRQVITDIFSGALLPISFYPIWFQKFADLLPFQSIVYLPTQLFLGRVRGQEAVQILLVQCVWVLVIWMLGHLFFKFAIRKITIQGG